MKKLLLTPIIAAGLFACSKKTDDVKPLTAREYITSGKYFVQSMQFDEYVTVNSTGVVTKDALVAAPCVADDQITFLPNGTTFEDDKNLSCGGSQTESNIWSLSADNQILTWKSEIYSITKIDAGQLTIYKAKYGTVPGITLTLKH